ncbi:MAG: hypothetical protein HYS23_01175 [Geobacter sp.]|nr:hypothetical protein [Geobacter sp.]
MADLQIAQTILAQLGGRRFITMTGAGDFIGGDNFLMFSLPAGFAKEGINKIRITLDWTDTYIFEALKVYRGPELKSESIEKLDYVYADDLEEIFTRVTGLDTHL